MKRRYKFINYKILFVYNVAEVCLFIQNILI